jgi:hypothetical protein
VEATLFDSVADGVLGMLPDEVGTPQVRARRWGLKLWFGGETPTKEHYEAQVIGAKHVAEATGLALEVGFHAEHPQADRNDAVLAILVSGERRWRKVLGREPVAGPFLGRPDDWRRVSETWADPDLDDPDLGMELAARLVDYVTALEPILRSGAAGRAVAEPPDGD